MSRASFTPLSSPSSSRPAFTIVELLIVIVVIAILAAISIVAYRGIQDRANSSAASSKATQIAKKLQLYYVENESYPVSLTDAGITDTQGLQYSFNNTASPKTFCITATTNNKSYYQNNTTATSPTQGGCAGHGQGGQQAITNLALNPNFSGSGSIATTWSAFSQGTSNAMTRSVSGNVQTLTATALIGGNRRIGIGNITSFGSIPANEKYFSARVKINTSGLASGTMLTLYFDFVNVSTYVGNRIATTTSTSATELTIGPFLMNFPVTRAEGFVWINPTSSADWTGSSTAQVSEFSMYTSDSPQTPIYKDGNSPNWVWNGTPNNSTSTGPAL